MDTFGDYETHITLQVEQDQLDGLRVWATQQGWKFLHIVLDRGLQASQPMLSRRSRGSLADQHSVADQLCRELRAAGFPPVVVKIEAAPWNPGVPQADAETPPVDDRYFEHHVKMLCNSSDDLARLTEQLSPHGARLSRNALRERHDGRVERFVTQRCFGCGRGVAQA